MLILDHFPEIAQGTTIVSTDVSPAMVERTKCGEYSRFEINRGLPSSLAMKHFEQQGRTWQARPELARMIDARPLNLIERWPVTQRFDLVMLRNVLIYFPAATKHDILRRVREQAMAPGAYLLLGTSESTLGVDPGFASRKFGQSTFFHPKEST